MTDHTDSPKASTPSLGSAIGKAASRLQDAYFGQQGDARRAAARRDLATLRAGAAKTPQQDIVSWQAVLNLTMQDFPERLLGKGNAPSRSELAAFDAMALFGLHMQSATQRMHTVEQTFAEACGILVRRRGDSDSIKPRFDAMLAVRNEIIRRRHAIGLIALLRTEKIGFDYGRFGRDLFTLSGANRNEVLLRWARDFTVARSRRDNPQPTSN